MKLKQVYHPWHLWEDYKSGFYNIDTKELKDLNKEKVVLFFEDEERTLKYMFSVIENWFFSCEHNLTNYNMNRIAYIGQAACCISMYVPNLTTMYSWKYIDNSIKKRSDDIAKHVIDIWEQNKKSQIILNCGRQKDMQKVYQTKLLLS